MVAFAGLGGFVSGLALGLVVGFLVGPVVRFWLAWNEWVDASREARPTARALKRMDEGPWRFLEDRRAAEASRPTGQASAP